MREDDDTILENGISNPNTPVLRPLSPLTAGAVSRDIFVAMDGVGPNVPPIVLPPQHPDTVSSVCRDVTAQPFVTNSIESRQKTYQAEICAEGVQPESIQPQTPCRRYRRCLSGDDTPPFQSFDRCRCSYVVSESDLRSNKSPATVEENSNSLRTSTDLNTQLRPLLNSGPSPVSVTENRSILRPSSREQFHDEAAPITKDLVTQQQEDIRPTEHKTSTSTLLMCTTPKRDKNIAVAIPSPRYDRQIQRSKSVNRRLNEAAQFAEAVGELPPASEEEILRDIIEEDSSSDDDDDDDEGTVLDTSEAVAEEMMPTATPPLTPISKKTTAVIGELAASSFGQEELDTFALGNQLDTSIPPVSSAIEENTTSLNEKAASPRRDQDIKRGKHPMPWRPQSCKRFNLPVRQNTATKHHITLLGHVPDGYTSGETVDLNHYFPQTGQPYVYKGIHSNPPEVTQRGVSRGNYAQLHRKAWLEVSDKYHRYGKNLRLYYKHWESLNHPTNMFFDWLDSKGEAAGQLLPNLPECPRSTLDSDTVLYITNPEIQGSYALNILSEREEEVGTRSGILVDTDGFPIRTGPDGWIFVLRDHIIYGAQKVTSIAGKSKQRFHHSSFFGGKAVAAAGILITDDTGRLTRLYPHSGHYRPGEAHMQRMLFFLQLGGIDLSTFDVDLQQILHVSRHVKDANTPMGGRVEQHVDEMGATTKKAKKVNSLHLMPALYVACYLAHKSRLIGEGTFRQIHKIRFVGAATVQEALEGIGEGGYWRMIRSQME